MSSLPNEFGVCMVYGRCCMMHDGARRGSADSAVIGFHSWILAQCKESVDANSGLFKETDDAALDQNLYEIRFCS